MAKKDKHIRLDERIIKILDKYADKNQWTKVVVYEKALKEFIGVKKDELIKSGIEPNLISDVLKI